MRTNYSIHPVMPLTPVVKKLIIINVSVWLVLVLIVQNFFMSGSYVFRWLGLNPFLCVGQFFLWQPVTYMFLHDNSVFHILFNMLLLWWLGSELEQRWGGRFFLTYYMFCGVGAAFIYLVGIFTYYLISGNPIPLNSPVVGASGAVFGLLLAYGLIFGERIIYLFFMFAMKAKYCVLLLGLFEFLTLLSSGFSHNVANLAHLGGILAGFIFLNLWARWVSQKKRRKFTKKRGHNLTLVVNSKEDPEDFPPKYWH